MDGWGKVSYGKVLSSGMVQYRVRWEMSSYGKVSVMER